MWRLQRKRERGIRLPVLVGGDSRKLALYGNVEFGENVVVGDYIVLGYPKEARVEEARQRLAKESSSFTMEATFTSIGTAAHLGSHIVVGEGTRIGSSVFIEDFCRIGFNCMIGDQTRIMYGAFVCDRVRIGTGAKIAGFICDAAVIGDSAAVMGQLVHEYTRPHVSWGIEEPAPRIEARAVVAFGAIIIGGVVVGENSYVAAGAIVTRDVPPRSVVTGKNCVIPADQWKGEKLAPEFWEWKGRE